MFDKTKFQGVVVPLVNPCKEDDSLDFELLKKNFERIRKENVQGYYINGGTGDAANLTTEERKEIAAYLIAEAKSDNRTAIVHVGQTSQRAATELALHAREQGADAVASIPPKKDWKQVVEYYRALAQTGVPVIVYYIPGMTGITAGMEQLRMILDIPGVIGIKMSDWNIFLMRCVMLEYPDRIVYSGFDEMLVPGLFYGADGCIGTWGNLLAPVYAKIYGEVRAGHADGVKDLMDEMTAFLSIGWNYGILDCFEELMAAKGYAGRCFRHPSSWNPGKVPGNVTEDLLARMDQLNRMAEES